MQGSAPEFVAFLSLDANDFLCTPDPGSIIMEFQWVVQALREYSSYGIYCRADFKSLASTSFAMSAAVSRAT
jgi:hypothetical protein